MAGGCEQKGAESPPPCSAPPGLSLTGEAVYLRGKGFYQKGASKGPDQIKIHSNECIISR